MQSTQTPDLTITQKKNNVLLEEMSGFYYLTAFWELLKEKKVAHFIAATGVNKLPNFANMFLGWGLDYIVVVDDDKSGRGVFNQLKKEIYADDEELAKKNMYKIKDCTGIEDIFSSNDFKNIVLKQPNSVVNVSNSQYMKDKKLSKPVLAHTFLAKVRAKDTTLEMFDAETIEKMNSLVSEIKARLT